MKTQTRKNDRSPGLEQWLRAWKELMTYTGSRVPNPEKRIKEMIALWQKEIPGKWQREDLPRNLIGYRRKPDGNKPTPEHELEKELFAAARKGALKMDGYEYVDLVTCAFPLARWRTVEADLIAIAGRKGATEVLLIEAKDKANNAWYAVGENLIQLKLFQGNPLVNLAYLKESRPTLSESSPPTTGLVIAPPDFFGQSGKKANSKQPAFDLLTEFGQQLGVTVLLGVWQKKVSTIEVLSPG